MVIDSDVVIRLILAAIVGAMVGYERERQNQPAGLRTHIILVLGATLAMLISINVPVMFRSNTGSGDPARIAAQVVSGIGFLGAGAILRYGTTIKGLTTAASMWTTAVIGLTLGAGMYFAGLLTALLLIITLSLLNLFEKRILHTFTTWEITLEALDSPGLLDQFRDIVSREDRELASTGVTKNVQENLLTVEATMHALEGVNPDKMVESLSELPGVRSVRVHT